MAEGMHAAAAGQKPVNRTKYAMVAVGTVVAVLSAGVLVQFLRPNSAYPDAAPSAASEGAGRASISDQGRSKRYVARVGKQLVDFDELADECVQRYGGDILENIINRKIIQQECADKGVEVTEAEVNEEILKIAKKFNLPVDSWMQMLQAERNLTPQQYKRDIIWPMLALRKLAGDDVAVTKADLDRAFIRNYGPRVKARAIVLDHQRRANEVWEKVRANPEEFERIARSFSIDPASRPLGGSIPPIQRYGNSPELEAEAFKLKPGEISGVIQVGMNQWVILLCEGQTEQIVTDPAAVEDILKQELHEQKVQQSVAKVFEKLKAQARVDNYIANTSTGGKRAAAAEAAGSDVQPVQATMPAGSPAKRVAPAAGGQANPAAPRTASENQRTRAR